MKKNLNITNPPFNERIWPVLSHFVKLRFPCTYSRQKFSDVYTLSRTKLLKNSTFHSAHLPPSGKSPYHLTSNRKVCIFWLNSKNPKKKIPDGMQVREENKDGLRKKENYYFCLLTIIFNKYEISNCASKCPLIFLISHIAF